MSGIRPGLPGISTVAWHASAARSASHRTGSGPDRSGSGGQSPSDAAGGVRNGGRSAGSYSGWCSGPPKSGLEKSGLLKLGRERELPLSGLLLKLGRL